MKNKLLLFIILAVVSINSYAQPKYIQGTIKSGAAPNEFEIWLRADFNNDHEVYLAQIGLPIAIPATAPVSPTGLTVTLDDNFKTNFGNNYTISVNPVATSAGGSEKYYNIILTRLGAGASDLQQWTAGNEFKVLSASFLPSGAPRAPVKLADYQDGGSDGQGYFYTADGLANYYYNTNSIANFYSVPGQSLIGGTASAGYAQTLSAIALPVNLLNFSGYREGFKNTLTWATANEMNNRGFEVQRSTDGISYTVLGFVNSRAANGYSNGELNYNYVDNSPAGSKQYYRLRQLDIDSRSKLSNVIVITGDKPSRLLINGLYPVPALSFVNIVIGSPGTDRVTIAIYDLTGRMVRQQQANVGEGFNTIPVDIVTLAKGSYLLKVKGENDKEEKSEKFIK